jgi:transcriptional regulator with XRE-family HTH domain
MGTTDTSVPTRGARDLAGTLIGARSAAGLTQEELADRTGLSVRAIRNLETGRTSRPHPQSLRLLTEALRIHGAELPPRRPAPRGGAGPVGVSGARLAPPRQPFGSEMPPDAPWLVGRDPVFAQLADYLSDAGGTRRRAGDAEHGRAAVVTGPPGSGRTATLARTARLLADRFPDRQVYVDLDCPPHGPMTASAVLVRVLRSFGVDPLPQSAEESAARVRALLTGQRTLLVLDNAVSEAQIRPLLSSSARSAVLVAGRRELPALPAGLKVRLDLLAPGDARRMLARLAGRSRAEAEPEAVEIIARFCGRLPLALHIAGLWLAARPERRLRDLAERLADERRRLDLLQVGDLSLRSSLAACHRTLTREQQSALRRLATLPGPFDARDAASVLGITVGRAVDIVEELVHCQTVRVGDELPPTVKRYQLHDAFRAFAACPEPAHAH